MSLVLRLVQLVTCPIGVPLGVMCRAEGEGWTRLVTEAGPAVFVLTGVFVVATALMDTPRRGPALRLDRRARGD